MNGFVALTETKKTFFHRPYVTNCAVAMIIAFKSKLKKNNVNFGYPEMENYYYC